MHAIISPYDAGGRATSPAPTQHNTTRQHYDIMLHYIENDGGRTESGFGPCEGSGDCVTRAFCILTGVDYKTAWDRFAYENKESGRWKTADRGVAESVMEKVFTEAGLVKVQLPRATRLSDVHSMHGDCVVQLTDHVAVVKNDGLHDSWDSRIHRRSGRERTTKEIWRAAGSGPLAIEPAPIPEPPEPKRPRGKNTVYRVLDDSGVEIGIFKTAPKMRTFVMDWIRQCVKTQILMNDVVHVKVTVNTIHTSAYTGKTYEQLGWTYDTKRPGMMDTRMKVHARWNLPADFVDVFRNGGKLD